MADYLPPTDAPLLECVETRWHRGVGVFFFGALVAFVLSFPLLTLFQEVLLPHWEPPARFNLAIGVSIPVGAAVALMRNRWRTFGMSLYSDVLVIHRLASPVTCDVNDIIALVGMSGIDLSGGELITWKRLVFITAQGRHILAFEPEINSQIYAAVIEFCPHCVGIPYPAERVDNSNEADTALPSIIRLIKNAAVKKFASGAAVFISIASLVAFAVLGGMKGEEIAGGSVALIIGAAGGVAYIVSAVRDVLLARKLNLMAG